MEFSGVSGNTDPALAREFTGFFVMAQALAPVALGGGGGGGVREFKVVEMVEKVAHHGAQTTALPRKKIMSELKSQSFIKLLEFNQCGGLARENLVAKLISSAILADCSLELGVLMWKRTLWMTYWA